MKRPLAFLLLLIAIAWLLKYEQISITSAAIEPICGNGICEEGEDNIHCSIDCPKPICGNNVAESGEECDGIDDFLCPELCRTDCKCPPTWARDRTILPYRYAFFYTEINPNEIVTINLNRPKIDILGANVILNKSLHNVNFILDSNVTAPPIKPNGTVHSYFKLQLDNSSQEKYITYLEIFFRVPTEWTVENDVKEIRLEHAEAQSWQPLNTQKLYQDLDYVYFLARSNKMGLFATVSPPKPQKPQPVCGNGILEEGETYINCCIDAGCPEGQSCISNQCKIVTICGNNVCELGENATNCPTDCALVQFGGSAALILVLLITILIITLFRKLPSHISTKPKARPHATPERWF
jgi:PGF-pre-PGF domain-containing protein